MNALSDNKGGDRPLTYDDVAHACEELKQRGMNVTVRGVRLILKTGSMQTLMAFIAQWRRAEENSLVEIIEKLRAELAKTQTELEQTRVELTKLKKRFDPETPY